MRSVAYSKTKVMGGAFAAALLACACTGAPAGQSFLANGNAPDRVYRLSPGDKLKVTVFGEENLSGPTEVSAQGLVALPLAGEVEARGLTVNQFRDSVARRLSDGYLKNPKVTVEIMNYRPIYVTGEVKGGGEFQYKSGINLRDAIAMAGGYTYRADQGFVYISRSGQAEAAVSISNSIIVLPGDNIRVPERFF